MSAPPERPVSPEGELVRGLGAGSAFAVVVGGVIGSGVFLVSADINASVSSPSGPWWSGSPPACSR
jgi:APA family basic amino acid/polyamine antiporter